MSNTTLLFNRLLRSDMAYTPGKNNLQTGVNRTKLSVLIVTRFGLISPGIIRWLYDISQPQALAHLNKLTTEGYLSLVRTHRCLDGRVYVPKFSAIKYAEELLGVGVSAAFRTAKNPAFLVNLNSLTHDLMNTFILLAFVHGEKIGLREHDVAFGFVTETEYKRLAPKMSRNIDGLLQLGDERVAIEIENSFKTKSTRQTILLKHLHDLKQGYYDKIFFISHSKQTLADVKRLNDALIGELITAFNKKTGTPFFSNEDAMLLNESLVYRSKFCELLTEQFYPEMQ